MGPLADVWQSFTLQINVFVFMGVITGADVHCNEAWLIAQLWFLHRDPGLNAD